MLVLLKFLGIWIYFLTICGSRVSDRYGPKVMVQIFSTLWKFKEAYDDEYLDLYEFIYELKI
jgi:hypothetical protein